MNNKIKLLIAMAIFALLSSCGGGGDDNSNQPFACSGVILPSSGGSVIPVAGWCTPAVTSTVSTPQNSLSNCCIAYRYSDDRFSTVQYSVQIGKSDLSGKVCTQARAYFACQ
jgi:hypothetical protein